MVKPTKKIATNSRATLYPRGRPAPAPAPASAPVPTPKKRPASMQPPSPFKAGSALQGFTPEQQLAMLAELLRPVLSVAQPKAAEDEEDEEIPDVPNLNSWDRHLQFL